MNSRLTSSGFHSLAFSAAIVSSLLTSHAAAQVVYALDDGTGSVNIGPTFPAEFMWGNVFDASPAGQLINTISVAYGSLPTSPATPVRLYLFEDPTDDLDPRDAVLVATTTGLSDQPRTNVFINYPITPTIVRGTFFVAASCQVDGVSLRPGRLDPQSIAQAARAWVFGADTFTFPAPTLPDLAASPYILNMSQNIVRGTFLVRATGSFIADCSPADIANTDGDPSSGPDNQLNNGDFTVFFTAFFAEQEDPARLAADIANTDGVVASMWPGGSSIGGPDGQVDNGDFQAFFSAFFTGCR